MQLFAMVPDFNEPIDALYICHENILKRMATIETMAAQILKDGPPAFASQIDIWREIFSFIQHSIANHTRDEEEGLFPLLAERTGVPLETLFDEHDRAEQTESWLAERFEILTAEPPSGQEPSEADAAGSEALKEFARRALWLAGFYRGHIATENESVFPQARAALGDEDKRALGALMRRHRNITPTLPPQP